MIIIQNITKHIGARTLFENITLTIKNGERVALVGPNGCGKSTLLKILVGQEDADAGNFSFPGEKIAFVPQELVASPKETIKTYLNTYDFKATESLKAVGVHLSLDRALRTLSGGQKTRLMLAKALLNNPTVLLIDEPTNHLDKAGVAWLRAFLARYKGTVLLVSHDRTLLEDMTRIVEIDSAEESIEVYIGGYAAYKEARAKRLEEKRQKYEEQQNEKERLEERLQWFTTQSQRSSNPTLGKKIRAMEKRIEREIYSQELNNPTDGKKLRGMSLEGATHDGKLLIDAKNLALDIEGKKILHDVSFEVRGTERVILSGANGSGKTSLMRILMGLRPQTSGTFRIGVAVNVGYFAQEHEVLNPKHTVLESFLDTDRLVIGKQDPKNILASFLFSDRAIQKRITDLSPGERVRLIFAKLTHQRNELLLLDEPTNHLDLQSKEVVEKALAEYEGGILAISHDPYFISAIGAQRELVLDGGVVHSRLLP